MKAHYDFSSAERGKFYRPDAVFHLPVYLDPDVAAFLSHMAEERQADVQVLVNEWLRASIKVVQSVPAVMPAA